MKRLPAAPFPSEGNAATFEPRSKRFFSRQKGARLLLVTGEVEVAEIVPDENDFSHTKALIDTDHTGVNLTSVEKIVWTGISEMSRSVAVCAWVSRRHPVLPARCRTR